jgi:hypothetical protein
VCSAPSTPPDAVAELEAAGELAAAAVCGATLAAGAAVFVLDDVLELLPHVLAE